MVKQLHVALVASVLLTSGGAYYYVKNIKSTASPRLDSIQIAQRRDVLEQCLHTAQIVFDVHWAAACSTQLNGDDGAECDLPTDKAAVVNAWLNDAEKLCMAEARAAP